MWHSRRQIGARLHETPHRCIRIRIVPTVNRDRIGCFDKLERFEKHFERDELRELQSLVERDELDEQRQHVVGNRLDPCDELLQRGE